MGEIFDDTILLKIKRDFTESEAVQQLLKMISELEIEIGVLKSERDEWKDLADRLRTTQTMTKKQWLQEEAFTQIVSEKEVLKRKKDEYKKGMEDWRNRYFSLLAKKSNCQND